MIIARGLPIAAAPTVSSGTGAGNLLTYSPREIWAAAAVGTASIDIDLGSAQNVDTFYLGYTNAAATATWGIQRGTGLGTGLVDVVAAGTPMRAADSLGPRHHALAVLAAPVNSQFFRITVTQTGAAPMQAGILMLSAGFVCPYEYGSGREPIDTSSIDELPDGGFGIGEGVVKVRLEWTFIDLTAAVRRALWALTWGVGKSKPILVVEQTGETAGLNEEIHYGLFDRFEPYQRQAVDQTRWAFSMKEWR